MLSPLKTPLVPITLNDDAPVYCKLEYLQPSGSTKDRLSFFILSKALRNGSVKKGDYVIEASSGSTSISLAMVSANLGLNFIAVMPEGVSPERIKIITAYGAKVVLTPRQQGIAGSLEKCKELASDYRGFLPRQFENEDNARAHQTQTAQEIAHELQTQCIDAVVSGVGTGGTLVGIYRGLCDFGCDVKAVLAKPVSRELISDVECCSFSNRIPGVVDGLSTIFRKADLPDLIEINVDDHIAIETTRQLIRKGFPVGPSSGLNFAAAQMVRQLYPHLQTIVTIFPDRMERYFSTPLFQEFTPQVDGITANIVKNDYIVSPAKV